MGPQPREQGRAGGFVGSMTSDKLHASQAGSSGRAGGEGSSSRGHSNDDDDSREGGTNNRLGVFSSRDPFTNFVVLVALVIGLLRWSLLPKCTC